MTGGLAAPLVAAGAATIIGSAGAAALGSVAGIAVMTSLFGAAGAGLTGEVTEECGASGGCSARGPGSHIQAQILTHHGSPGDRGEHSSISCWVPALQELAAGFLHLLVLLGRGVILVNWGGLYHRPTAPQSHTQIPVPLPKWDPSLPTWRIVVTLTHFFERNVLLL